MFVTTEPVPGEKLKIGMFSSKVMSKFVDICDEVRKMRLCIAPPPAPETLPFRNPKYPHGFTTLGCGCIPKVSL